MALNNGNYQITAFLNGAHIGRRAAEDRSLLPKRILSLSSTPTIVCHSLFHLYDSHKLKRFRSLQSARVSMHDMSFLVFVLTCTR